MGASGWLSVFHQRRRLTVGLGLNVFHWFAKQPRVLTGPVYKSLTLSIAMIERRNRINIPSAFFFSTFHRNASQTRNKTLLTTPFFPHQHLASFQIASQLPIVMTSLLEPVVIGGKLSLRNRVVMGSMTRNRCVDNLKPGPAQIRHYADRARDGVGLIVNEGTFVDWTGCDWDNSPVMIDQDHARAWRLVTDAVHKEGGKIFFQAWHAGKTKSPGRSLSHS